MMRPDRVSFSESLCSLSGVRTAALVKDLEGVGGDRQSVTDVGVASEDLVARGNASQVNLCKSKRECPKEGRTHLVDMPRELGPLVLVDRVGDVGAAALHEDLAARVRLVAGRVSLDATAACSAA